MYQATIILLSYGSGLLLAAQPAPQTTFEGLSARQGGQLSAAHDVSADGRTVVGYASVDGELRAMRWDDGTPTELVGLPNAAHNCTALAVSADGSTIVGRAMVPESRALRWTQPGLSALGASAAAGSTAEALGVSADGHVAVGMARIGRGHQACRWTDAGPSLLEDIAGGALSGVAHDVSADGRVTVGKGTSAGGTHAVRWDASKLSRLSDLPGGSDFGCAYAITPDARIIVGHSESAFGIEACVWIDGQPMGLGGLAMDHEFLSAARAVSDDGRIVAGWSLADGDTEEAFIWDTHNGMRPLAEILRRDHGLDLGGWRLEAVSAMSADGRTLVGYGRNPAGRSQAWRAVLPGAPSPDGNTQPGGLTLGHMHYAGTKRLVGASGAAQFKDGRWCLVESAMHRVSVWSPGGELLETWDLRVHGQALRAPSDVVIDAAGHAWITDTGNHRIIEVDGSGRALGAWGQLGVHDTAFNRPEGIAVHEAALYVADTGNDRIQVLDANGTLLRTMGRYGRGAGQLNAPRDVAVADDGQVFVADTGNDRVVVFDAQGQWIQAIGAAGALAGLFNEPQALAWIRGTVVVSDSGNHRLQQFDGHGRLLGVWGRPEIRPHSGRGRLSTPGRLVFSGPQAVLCEPLENRCQLFQITDLAPGRRTDPLMMEPSTPPAHPGPQLSTHGTRGLLAVLEARHDRVSMYRLPLADSSLRRGVVAQGGLEPRLVSRVGGYGRKLGQFDDPAGVWLNAANKHMLVTERGSRRLQKFDIGPVTGDEIPDTRVPLTANAAIHFDQLAEALGGVVRPGAVAEHLLLRPYVVDEAGGRVIVLDREFALLHTLDHPDPASQPVAVGFSIEHKQVYVSDPGLNQVRAYDLEGRQLWQWPDGEHPPHTFGEPAGACGFTGFLYVVDARSHQVVQLTEDGRYLTHWGRRGLGPGEMFKPRGITVNTHGQLMISDHGNRRVVLFDHQGKFESVFGPPLYTRPARFAAATGPAAP